MEAEIMNITAKDYYAYIERAAAAIHAQRDYVTGLDMETGDGDHWVNINSGFEALCAIREELENLSMADCFKKIGMTLMSKIGGSSGVLYGGGYLAAAKAVKGKSSLTTDELFGALEAMLSSMMERGDAVPGMKTMLDALAPAIRTYSENRGEESTALFEKVREAALAGAEATRDMPAVKGRASYRIDKGVGHIDPGAVTMSIQLAELCDYLTTLC